MMDKISKNIFISLGIIAMWTLLVFVIFYKDNSGLGKMFGVSIMFIITSNFAVGLGLLILALRIFRVMKNNFNLVYIFSITINLSIAILAIGLFLFGDINMRMFHNYLLNLIVGFLLLANIVLRSFLFDKSRTDV